MHEMIVSLGHGECPCSEPPANNLSHPKTPARAAGFSFTLTWRVGGDLGPRATFSLGATVSRETNMLQLLLGGAGGGSLLQPGQAEWGQRGCPLLAGQQILLTVGHKPQWTVWLSARRLRYRAGPAPDFSQRFSAVLSGAFDADPSCKAPSQIKWVLSKSGFFKSPAWGLQGLSVLV